MIPIAPLSIQAWELGKWPDLQAAEEGPKHLLGPSVGQGAVGKEGTAGLISDCNKKITHILFLT